MKPNPIHRLPAPLESAVQRLKLAAREATERTIESLGLAALAAHQAFQRDGLLGAQFELNRKSAVFALAFNEALDERIQRELSGTTTGTSSSGTPSAGAPAGPADWEALSLVDDQEVEAQISAERFGMEIAVACEWELRELEAYAGTLLEDAGGSRERNPLRPDLVGHALIRGVDAVSDRPETRKILVSEMGRSLGGLLRSAYGNIVSDWRGAGVQPMGLSVRNRMGRDRDAAQASTAGELGEGSEFGGPDDGPGSARRGGGPRGRGADSRYAGSGFGASSGTAHGSLRGTPIGQVDPALMNLMRRLAHADMASSGGGLEQQGWSESSSTGYGGQPLPNLIRNHREELRQASTGSLDHMVIDVIGFLFDQILADPKVPPQMARQIARLQLPVLRAALGDPRFFSSRRHPVRRFVNRIASLGAGFEDFSEDPAKSFLAKVKALVQEVVEGDFDQIETYDRKLAELESFVAEQAAREDDASHGSAALLSEKEDEYRLRQLYAQRLAGDLKDIAAPAFLLDFVARVWSQVLVAAMSKGAANDAQVQRLRKVGRDLLLSVQPKPSPAARKTFLAELPRLMQDLTEGMNLIAWPEAQRRAFFGQLMPAHAESLRSTAVRQLDINLLAIKVNGALERPLPSKDELRGAPALPVLMDEIPAPKFSAEEARQIGLVEESAVDWNSAVPPEAGAVEAEAAQRIATAPMAPGLPAATEAPEPSQGRALADDVQIGFAYQMHMNGDWHKVRLSHVSAGRSFFIFTHGGRHKQTVSLTYRMLSRLCETGRMRTFENATLIERATLRARRQLATLGAAHSGASARA